MRRGLQTLRYVLGNYDDLRVRMPVIFLSAEHQHRCASCGDTFWCVCHRANYLYAPDFCATCSRLAEGFPSACDADDQFSAFNELVLALRAQIERGDA